MKKSGTQKRQKKIVILGGSGFVGRALTEHFRKQGKRVFSFSSSDFDLRYSNSVEKLKKVLDPGTTLVIAAAITLDAHRDSMDVFLENMEILTHIGRSLMQYPIAHCVYLSTASVYGDAKTDLRIDEQTPVVPTTFYGVSKYAGECLLEKIAADQKVPLLILRPCRVYGPGMIGANYGPARFIQSIMERKEVEIYGDGGELRDQLYIGDLVRGVDALLKKKCAGVYNLASGRACSFQEILKALKRIVTGEFKISYRPRTRPLIDQCFVIKKFSRAVPHFRFTPLRDGLKKTFLRFVSQ